MQATLNKVDDQTKDPDKVADKTKDIYDPDQDSDAQDVIKNVSEDLKKYYKNIPFSAEAKLAALSKIEMALFNTGKIYFEDLKEYPKAKTYLLSSLNRFPEGVNEPETYFILNKIATELGANDEADKYSKLLDKKYPKSPFNLVFKQSRIGGTTGGKQ